MALTGPVERNDFGTVIKQFEVLAPPDLHIYKALSKKLLELAVKKHPEQDYTDMRQILKIDGLDK